MELPPITNVAPPVATPQGSEKIWTVLSHLSVFMGVPFLLPLVIYLVMKNESAYVSENAREALNFHLSLLIYSLCCLPLLLIGVGFLFLAGIGLASFILAILAAVKASDGICYRYPMTLRLI